MTEQLPVAELLPVLEATGAWAGPAVWVPVLIWTLLALPLSAALRFSPWPPSLRYRLQQALLAALPASLVAGAWIDLSALGALLAGWPAAPPSVGTVVLSDAVALSSGATAASGWGWSWTHALGLLTVAAVAASGVQALRLARSAVALIRLHDTLPHPAGGAPNKLAPNKLAQQMAGELAEALALRRVVRVRCTSAAMVPMTYGLLRPTIVVPAALADRPEALRMTLMHELVHIRRFDVLARWVEQAVVVAAAIHPGVWWLTRVIERTREMACDAEALRRTRSSRKAYADLIYGFSASATQRAAFAVSIAETSSMLKERIQAMMTIDRSNAQPRRHVPWIAGALLLAITLSIVACSDSITPGASVEPGPAQTSDAATAPSGEVAGEVFVVVEDKPKLMGGMEALSAEVQYPEFAKKAGIQGRVFVRFVVDKNGDVRAPEITRGVHELLDQEALRAVQQMEFEPGRQRGQAVNVQMALPITFRLSEKASSPSPSSSEDTGKTELQIRIDADGAVFVDGQAVAMDAVQSAVEAAIKRIDQKVVVSLLVDQGHAGGPHRAGAGVPPRRRSQPDRVPATPHTIASHATASHVRHIVDHVAGRPRAGWLPRSTRRQLHTAFGRLYDRLPRRG